MEEASTSGSRSDGRGQEEFRTVFIKTHILSQAKGSAYVEFGTSKVMVGVFGPRQSEVKLGFSECGRINVEVRLTSFAAARLSKAEQGSLEAGAATVLQQALEASVLLDRFPKAVFDVSAMLLEGGGGGGGGVNAGFESDTAALLSAASLALADAGVEMHDLVPAVAVSKQGGGSLLLDPSPEEAASGEGSLLLGLMPELNEVAVLQLRGCWGDTELRSGLELAMGGAAQLRGAMREALVAALEEPAA